MKLSFKHANPLVKGTIFLSLSALLTKVFGVLYKIPLSYILTDEGMGYFNSAYTVFGLFYIISTAGVPKAVTMIITGEDDSDREYIIYKFLLRIFFIAGMILSIVFVLLSPILSSILATRKSLYTMLSIAPSILFVSVGGVVRGYLNGRSNLKPIAISQLIEAVAKLCLGLIFASIAKHQGFALPQIASFSIFGITLGSFFSCIYLLIKSKNRIKSDKIKQNFFYNKNAVLRKFIRIALPITLSSSVLSLSSVLDVGIIMRALLKLGLSESQANALYGNYTTLAIPMLNLVTSLLTPICVAYLPKLTSLHIAGKREEFNRTLERNIFTIVLIASPIAFAYYYYPFEILDILYSAGASSIGAELLRYLSIAVILLPVVSMLNTALEAKERIRASVVSLVIGTIFKIFVTSILMYKTSLGILAAPIGTVISYLISFIISMFFLEKCRSRIDTLNTIILPVALCFISFSLPYHLFFTHFSSTYSLLTAVLFSASSMIIYLFLLFLSKKLGNFAKNVSHYVQKAR